MSGNDAKENSIITNLHQTTLSRRSLEADFWKVWERNDDTLKKEEKSPRLKERLHPARWSMVIFLIKELLILMEWRQHQRNTRNQQGCSWEYQQYQQANQSGAKRFIWINEKTIRKLKRSDQSEQQKEKRNSQRDTHTTHKEHKLTFGNECFEGTDNDFRIRKERKHVEK